jgi:hypothetical protein
MDGKIPRGEEGELMANSLVGNVWYVDTAGIISKKPITLRGVMFYPNTQADAILFNWWDEAEPYTPTSSSAATVHATTHIDSTGTFASTTAFAATNVVRISHYTGAYKIENETYHLIQTRTSDNILTIAEASLTADSACSMTFHPYPSRVAIQLVQPADTNQYSMWVPFPGPNGFTFHNLALESISATCSAQLYLA